MRGYLIRCGLVLVVPVAVLLLTAAAAGPDPTRASRYLLVGGGSSPFNTQVSLEEHVTRFRALLARHGDEGRTRLLFADGGLTRPVVVLRSEGGAPDGLEADLAMVMGRSDERALTWRTPALKSIDGAAARETLGDALSNPGTSTKTVLYFAGHGNREQHGRVSLSLWGDERVSDVELSHWLDRLPPEHRFIGLFTQCHAGGFGSLLYPHGDPRRGLVSHDRCAFFAAPADRLSSGCTPEANRSEPDDYSTWLLTALSGRTHDGKALTATPDYDGDGHVDLEEAHAYARIHDGTINVPLSTSELLLEEATGDLEMWDELTLASPFAALVARARPAERAVLRSLAQELGVKDDPGAALKARYEADRLGAERQRLERELHRLTAAREGARTALRKSLFDRWPWLNNPYHPQSAEILRQQRSQLQEVLQGGDRAELDRRSAEVALLRSRTDAIERRWARWERLARAAESVVREAHLRAVGSPAQVSRLDAVLRCQSDRL